MGGKGGVFFVSVREGRRLFLSCSVLVRAKKKGGEHHSYPFTAIRGGKGGLLLEEKATIPISTIHQVEERGKKKKRFQTPFFRSRGRTRRKKKKKISPYQL